MKERKKKKIIVPHHKFSTRCESGYCLAVSILHFIVLVELELHTYFGIQRYSDTKGVAHMLL